MLDAYYLHLSIWHVHVLGDGNFLQDQRTLVLLRVEVLLRWTNVACCSGFRGRRVVRDFLRQSQEKHKLWVPLGRKWLRSVGWISGLMQFYDWHKARYLNYVFSWECLSFRFFWLNVVKILVYIPKPKMCFAPCRLEAWFLILTLIQPAQWIFMLRFELRLLEFVTSNSCDWLFKFFISCTHDTYGFIRMIRGIAFRRDTEKQLRVCAYHATICILTGCIPIFWVLKLYFQTGYFMWLYC